ncbi:conserved Plasmodium protein, unknown function [Plasmodium yoelii]|uniref:Uncharacterized protein n=2 Tax=Plasmodium yoelii TaxID=5861 RepID=A0AAE9WN47_PLAYO|nr:conserved Plasmodium protein, unknown function [Plasmodium yoelii]WBY57123.1 hypothetical protein Py17XNL_000900073 [Plasmodium yoelii yoelii]CDU17820.1 conserved Plasmodium protein, unknown function [Plasmodium yoelii]VTZ78237.1 conserved Plasmodium protein, unknown function [Plasmodium yoelii]|eukprot:XP_022812113.1 conserved Plasmodium protein, unknown function [Plasmodium yoelii]
MNTLSEYKRIKQAVFDKNKFNLKKKYIQNEKVRNNTVENAYNNHYLYEVSKNNYRENPNKVHKNTVIDSRNELFDPVFKGYNNFSKENTSSIERLANLRCTNESNKSEYEKNERSGRSEGNIKQGYQLADEEYLDFSAQHRSNEKNTTGIVKYEYCYICETAKPCFCVDENYDNDKEIPDWHNTNIKSNVHLNLKDISFIMEKIQSTKKKQEEPPVNKKKNNLANNFSGKKKSEKKKPKKILSIYERFHRDKIQIVKDKLSNLRNGKELLDEEVYMDYKSISDYEKDENFMKDRMEALKNMEKKHLELLSALLYEHKEMGDQIL